MSYKDRKVFYICDEYGTLFYYSLGASFVNRCIGSSYLRYLLKKYPEKSFYFNIKYLSQLIEFYEGNL